MVLQFCPYLLTKGAKGLLTGTALGDKMQLQACTAGSCFGWVGGD